MNSIRYLIIAYYTRNIEKMVTVFKYLQNEFFALNTVLSGWKIEIRHKLVLRNFMVVEMVSFYLKNRYIN